MPSRFTFVQKGCVHFMDFSIILKEETPTEIEDLFNFYFSLEPDYLELIINEI